MNQKIEMFDIFINNLNMDEAIMHIEHLIDKNNKAYVVTPNVDHIVRLKKDKEFKKIYENADLVLADGMPLVIASKLFKKPLKEKVSGSDLFVKMCEKFSEKEYRMFFLGGLEGVALKASENIKNKYPNIHIVGTYSPPFGFENDEEETKNIISMIKEKNVDILFVGLGSPKQEKWIYDNKSEYDVPVSLAIGASFDFVAGTVKRAPKWISNIGMEWFYRFCKEPKRLFKRYFVDDSYFIKILIDEIKK